MLRTRYEADLRTGFLLAALLIYALPGRLSASFAFVRRHRVLGPRGSR